MAANLISQAFESNLLPIAFDIGRVLLYTTSISAIYCIIRGASAQSIKQLKCAVIGYAMLKSIRKFVILVDQITNNMIIQ